ncbi:hypothetical protein M3172_04930 [Mesobacillus subterraneus]|uniref:hypothetical protein n=1 Tax=Mesobacillus subterraneus TaxID=285983 RepID=UPI0020412C83|nr:hypothetical protein [Mesobacillus subterraneus]MCM3572523.1 hypothetical protein [Mesobacillus subterraneus]
MTKSYVKEVQAVIDLGYMERDALKIFEAITDHFADYIIGTVEVEEFHERALALRKNERAFYREMIDQALAYAGYSELSWREVKYDPSRVGRCAECMGWYYNVSRNGKKITCDRLGVYRQWDKTNREYRYYFKDGNKLSVCGAKYELARKPTTRRVQEVLFDAMPGGDDVQGNVFMDKVEDAYQRKLNPDHNAWTYWQR